MEEAIKQAFVVGLGELNTSKARSQHGSIRKEQIEIDKLVVIIFCCYWCLRIQLVLGIAEHNDPTID